MILLSSTPSHARTPDENETLLSFDIRGGVRRLYVNGAEFDFLKLMLVFQVDKVYMEIDGGESFVEPTGCTVSVADTKASLLFAIQKRAPDDDSLPFVFIGYGGQKCVTVPSRVLVFAPSRDVIDSLTGSEHLVRELNFVNKMVYRPDNINTLEKFFARCGHRVKLEHD